MERRALSTLALLAGLAGCASETEPTPEEKITASLQAFDKESADLMREFELAVDAAFQSGQVFEEIPGRETTVVHNGETFSCVDWNTGGKEVFCETGKVNILTANPNLVSVDRKNSATLFVGAKVVPMLQMANHSDKSGVQAQKAISVFLNSTNCTVNDNGEVPFTKDAEIMQKCVALRDNLRKRMVAIVERIAALRKIWGK